MAISMPLSAVQIHSLLFKKATLWLCHT